MHYNTEKPYTNKIFDIIKTTWNENTINGSLKINNNLVFHTDGIGTKGINHWKYKTFKEAVIDAFAMNINDLAMIGATPLTLQNHIFIPEDNHPAILQIIQHLADISKEYNIAITGGETSIHKNMTGMDISITMSAIPNQIHLKTYELDDILVGIPSSGIHSNGFSFLPQSCYTLPTKIYYKEMKKVYRVINCCNHITGGAFTKLKSKLSRNTDAILIFKSPQVFHDIHKSGITSEQMYKTFNCGYGMIVGVTPNRIKYVMDETQGDIIGKITKGTGMVWIHSSFDPVTVGY